ncbi:MAG: dTMP kinase [Anaerovoracaceae bacterium]
MKQGIFITIEGPDGSGKSTQLENIKKFFYERNIDAIFTREPGGTAIGEKIRGIVLDKNNSEMCDMTEALLYAASRAQHVAQVIKPALDQGKTVICDRFIDSSIVYQGSGRGLGDCVGVMNEFAVDGCMPDLTILLELDPSIGKGRIKSDQLDRLELEKIDFHNRVFDAYEKLKDRYPERIVGINGCRNIEAITKDIYRELDRIIDKVE